MYGLARWSFWEWGFRAKESALMDFPKAQSHAFVILAFGGPLYLCPALSQDHSSSLWPKRQPSAV